MKKMFILAVTSIFMLTGCGATETLSCTYKNSADTMDTKITYDIDHEKDEIKKVRITYNYDFKNNNNSRNGNNSTDTDNQIDGVGTGTDGTTNDSNIDDDGIIDGVVGSAIDTIIGGVTDIILDSAGIRDRHNTVLNTYGNVNGFSVSNTNDVDDNYMVTYVIDYDKISDTDLARFNLDRDLDTMRKNYVNQGYTCK